VNTLSPISSPERKLEDPEKAFIKLFSNTAPYRHRYEAFRDLVFCFAAALHNATPRPSRSIEEEYLRVIKQYEIKDRMAFAKLFSLLTEALEVAPRDVLGPIFMSLELGESRKGQFFTPPDISKMMAEIILSDIEEKISRGESIKVQEPAAGAGGMVLAVAEKILELGYNPAKTMYAHATDVDRTAALMCYVQLSLWNIPGTVVVGNSLTLEVREVWETPALKLPVLRL
jgi:type I restriction-modification system DNA methylase subunit